MSKSIRVLHVIGGSEFGGAVWIILSYISMLQARGCDVIVISSNESVGKVYQNAGCEVVPIFEMRREIHPILDLVAVKKIAMCVVDIVSILFTHIRRREASLDEQPHGWQESPLFSILRMGLHSTNCRPSLRFMHLRHWNVSRRIGAKNS